MSVEVPVAPVEQEHRYDCGPAALLTALETQFPGHNLSLEKLTELVGATDKKGSSPEDMKQALNALGLSYKEDNHGTVENLKALLEKKQVPIVHIVEDSGTGHYVAVKSIKNDKVEVLDPWTGTPKQYGVPFFTGIWKDEEEENDTSWYLVIGDRKTKQPTQGAVMKRNWRNVLGDLSFKQKPDGTVQIDVVNNPEGGIVPPAAGGGGQIEVQPPGQEQQQGAAEGTTASKRTAVFDPSGLHLLAQRGTGLVHKFVTADSLHMNPHVEAILREMHKTPDEKVEELMAYLRQNVQDIEEQNTQVQIDTVDWQAPEFNMPALQEFVQRYQDMYVVPELTIPEHTPISMEGSWRTVFRVASPIMAPGASPQEGQTLKNWRTQQQGVVTAFDPTSQEVTVDLGGGNTAVWQLNEVGSASQQTPPPQQRPRVNPSEVGRPYTPKYMQSSSKTGADFRTPNIPEGTTVKNYKTKQEGKVLEVEGQGLDAIVHVDLGGGNVGLWPIEEVSTTASAPATPPVPSAFASTTPPEGTRMWTIDSKNGFDLVGSECSKCFGIKILGHKKSGLRGRPVIDQFSVDKNGHTFHEVINQAVWQNKLSKVAANPLPKNQKVSRLEVVEENGMRYGKCPCGQDVELSGFTNTCECGREYNSSGQQLGPREQWGEETGEHPSDIGRIS